MEQELSYSFHLGSDKNKSKLVKRVAKDNLSGSTSLSNKQSVVTPKKSAIFAIITSFGVRLLFS